MRYARLELRQRLSGRGAGTSETQTRQATAVMSSGRLPVGVGTSTRSPAL